MSFYLSRFNHRIAFLSISLRPFFSFSISLSVRSVVSPSPPVDVSLPASSSSQSPPLSLLGCGEGRPCQCVGCQCGNSREHRGPFTEHQIKTGVRETPRCSLFLTAQQTNLVCMYARYRNVHNLVHNTANTSRPPACHFVPLSHSSHLSCFPTVGQASSAAIQPTCVQPITESHTHTHTHALLAPGTRVKHPRTTGSHFQRDHRMFFSHLNCVRWEC